MAGQGASSTAPTSTWFQFNDRLVTRSSFERMCEITKYFETDVPYMLFYVRERIGGEGEGGEGEGEEEMKFPEQVLAEVFSDNSRLLLEIEELAERKSEHFQQHRRDPGGDDGSGGDGGSSGNDVQPMMSTIVPKFVC